MANIMNFEALIIKELIRVGWKLDTNDRLVKENKMLSIYAEKFHCYEILKEGKVKHIAEYSQT